MALVSVVAAACLDRPVTNSSPATFTNVDKNITQKSIDKVDLLFVIDNSASMGDKQTYLSQAVPALISRLVTPNCVDPVSGTNYGPSDSGGNGTCAQGAVEFPPVHDMHIGVLSSSLGERLGNTYNQTPTSTTQTCLPSQVVKLDDGVTINASNDDRAELIHRSGADETPLADLGTSFFLNWFPNTAANAGKQASAGAPAIASSTQLEQDFASLVQGVGTYGCGVESQLESWYRFLVQPDPYASLSLDSSSHAQWTGVDATILKQRHDFLRPDSLVAIIDLTDENDSEVDVRALGGQGYLWMNTNFDPPRGTSSCAENAAGTGLIDQSTCETCDDPDAGSDPSCELGSYSASNDWGYNLNLRHVHETQKYGLLPQFPIQRYVLGLTSTTVPDRNGEYPPNANDYQGLTNRDCVNPLFAASLPDGTSTDAATLCNLTRGSRTASLVFYAHIGGVPHELLQQDPTNPDSPQKDTLLPSDWTKILGNDPATFDLTGIDPHMVESYAPRAGVVACPATGANADPISGCDWVTNQGVTSTGDPIHVLDVDREYACIFPLTTPRDCSNRNDPNVLYGCDCPDTSTLTPQELPPLCDPTTQTTQIAAKAYPTVRELYLAELLGQQGIVSSLCPIHVSPANNDSPPDPLYGYRPAMTAIVDRLKQQLVNECLPEPLQPDGSGVVPCLILVTLPTPGDESACSGQPGMSVPDPDILAHFQQAQETGWQQGGGAASGTPDPATLPVCQLAELTPMANQADFTNGSCVGSSDPGWCYVTGAAAGTCSQAILFTKNTPPSGATVSLQCIESAVGVGDGGAD